MVENIYIVNAFTADGKNGNPAGVMLGAEGLTESVMHAIATEVGLSETAFVGNSNLATNGVRFFTPTVEEPLCGHATIATWSLLYQLGKISAGVHTQETKAGILRVEIEQSGRVFMEQTQAAYYDEIEPLEIAHLLGIQQADFDASLCPQIVSTGLKDLMVPLFGKSALAQVRPDFEGIAEFSRQHDITGFHVFALLDNDPSLACARNFAPADGIPEECATGTSNGALLSLLKKKRIIRPVNDIYRIEQGESMNRLSYVYGTFRDGIAWVGGEAMIVKRPVNS